MTNEEYRRSRGLDKPCKIRAKPKPKTKANKVTWAKSKKQRQKWWNSLNSAQKEAQIKKWQVQKAERRKNMPVLPEKYNSKYPWLTEGVNLGNRAAWLEMIHKKNPWLKVA